MSNGSSLSSEEEEFGRVPPVLREGLEGPDAGLAPVNQENLLVVWDVDDRARRKLGRVREDVYGVSMISDGSSRGSDSSLVGEGGRTPMWQGAERPVKESRITLLLRRVWEGRCCSVSEEGVLVVVVVVLRAETNEASDLVGDGSATRVDDSWIDDAALLTQERLFSNHLFVNVLCRPPAVALVGVYSSIGEGGVGS